MRSSQQTVVSLPESPAELPRPAGVRGPITRRRLTRAVVLAATAGVLGLLPAVLGAPVWLRAAGLSVVFPGAGIAYSTPPLPGGWWLLLWVLQPLLAASALVGALHGLGRVITRGDYLTAPAVVLGSAAMAALLAHVHSHHPGHHPQSWVPATAALTAAGLPLALGLREKARARRARSHGDERNAHLAAVALTDPPPARTHPVALQHDAVPEHPGETDLADERDRQRAAAWIEALALQPAQKWAGWGGWGDEYLLPAMRYRIWAASLALSTLQHHHTPAFAGARSRAGRALIERYTSRQVWNYWLAENRWGMLRNSSDPIATPKNVMYSGYLLLATAMHARATGDRTAFDRADDVLRFQGETTYTRTALARRVTENFTRDEMCLWDCEPGLTFPVCNAVVLAGLTAHDTAAGTDRASEITAVFLRRLFDEFTAADGDPYAFQATRFGVAARGARTITNTAPMAALLGPLDPAFAWRTWHLLVREEIDSGEYLRTHRSPSTAPTDKDWGGGENRSNALAWSMFLARERGDEHRYRQLRGAAADLESEPTTFKPFTSSVHAASVLLLGALNRRDGWHRMLLGPAAATGPRLAEAPHPDLSVVTAVTDGHAHDAVLRRGSTAGRHRLGFDKLVPGARYAVHGAAPGSEQVTADPNGRAIVAVDVETRAELRLRPH